MSRKSVSGNCRICGKYQEKLSFEHVPPKSAFNKCPAVIKELLELINTDPDDYFNTREKIYLCGFGAYTLCERCNKKTGRWYGGNFADWARQSMEILERTQEASSIGYTFDIYPLRVIKQVICMFFSTNGDRFGGNHPDLVKFVLNQRGCHLDPAIRIFAFFSASPLRRYVGGSVKKEIDPDEINRDTIDNFLGNIISDFERSRVLSELAFPPIGYVMTFDSKPPPDNRLVDISHFAGYSYRDRKSIELRLPVLPVYTYFPGDYRDREQVRHDLESNT